VTHCVTVDLADDAYTFLGLTAPEWFVPGSAILRAFLAEIAEGRHLAERLRSPSQQR
jgi:hypothetical protein